MAITGRRLSLEEFLALLEEKRVDELFAALRAR